MTPEKIIKLLDLVPLPEEGGFYRETYRDSLFISAQEKDRYDGDRVASTCIYYLVTPEEFSALHTVKSTEIFHFYAGDPVRMIQINEEGDLQDIVLGSNLENQTPQVIAPPMTWQGVRLVEGGSWGL
ncbi:MAG: cupin domain-containing protein, partial [Bdellovibrionales bacterium]|nr:cupin domain-containing protein [Bdellovibrionales bacterium]NQZ19469.1 cupin domain-containing protein [Bdellovibrionales bacterium]